MQAHVSQDQQKQNTYTREASRYDETRIAPLVEEYRTSALLKLSGVREGMRVLDVAAGTGRTAIPLAQTGATVEAIDLTLEMLERMQSKADGLGLENLHITQANARSLPFPDDWFDVVVSMRFLHIFDFRDQMPFIREMHRVVKSEGRVLVEFDNDRWATRRRTGKLRDRWVNDRWIEQLYQDYHIVRQQGFGWPFMRTITRALPKLGKSLLELNRHPFAQVRWVVSTKRECEDPGIGASS